MEKELLKHIAGNATANPIQRAKHSEVLTSLLDKLKPINYHAIAKLNKGDKISVTTYRVLTIEHILSMANLHNWGLCKAQESIYLYNGCYWKAMEPDSMAAFLGEAAERLGVTAVKAKDYKFRHELYEQFMSAGHRAMPERETGKVLINLLNGTLEIYNGIHRLREHQAGDFLTYQLNFSYTPEAKAPMFDRFINEVLPDITRQQVLSEFLGYVFVSQKQMKLEKALLLFGGGANGKSVVFEVMNAIFGEENTSNFSLKSLCCTSGYYRAMIANKLVNYSSELSGEMEAQTFKQLASGEPIEARPIYGKPIRISDYAKLIFNTNKLPKDVEHTTAFFRRFLIIPFDVTIPEGQQDKELSGKIIGGELPGVLNWVLEGLGRLLAQKNFTHCDAIQRQMEKYKMESDSAHQFLNDAGYVRSTEKYVAKDTIYNKYKEYCLDNTYKPLGWKHFRERITQIGYRVDRLGLGNVIYAELQNPEY